MAMANYILASCHHFSSGSITGGNKIWQQKMNFTKTLVIALLTMIYLETWKFYGKKVLVGFTPVRALAKDSSMKLFNSDVHEYLHRFSNKSDDLSLDKMLDDINDPDKNATDPTGTTANEDLEFFYMALDMLIEYYDKCQQPHKSSCIRMLSEGYSKQEIAEQVTPELKKSRAYEFIQQTQKEG